MEAWDGAVLITQNTEQVNGIWHLMCPGDNQTITMKIQPRGKCFRIRGSSILEGMVENRDCQETRLGCETLDKPCLVLGAGAQGLFQYTSEHDFLFVCCIYLFFIFEESQQEVLLC